MTELLYPWILMLIWYAELRMYLLASWMRASAKIPSHLLIQLGYNSVPFKKGRGQRELSFCHGPHLEILLHRTPLGHTAPKCTPLPQILGRPSHLHKQFSVIPFSYLLVSPWLTHIGIYLCRINFTQGPVFICSLTAKWTLLLFAHDTSVCLYF